MSSVVEFTQPISYQSYFMKGEYETIKDGILDVETGEPNLRLQIYYQLQIESSRQYQTVFFFS